MNGILFLLLLTVYIVHSEVRYTYEFEKVVGGGGKSRSPWRSRASSISALHLFKGDVVEIQLCVSRYTELYIAGLNYSNDGASDTIVFEIDGNRIGDMVTELTTNGWGHHWNMHRMVGRIGNRFTVSRGKHTFTIKAVSTDCYGSELDRLELVSTEDIVSNLFCNVKLIKAANPTPCAVALDASFTRRTISTTTMATTTEENYLARAEQMSFKTNCLDKHNVNIRFRTKHLKGTEITAKSTSSWKKASDKMPTVKPDDVIGRSCKKIVWQIGDVNRDNRELGDMWSDDHIDFDVNSHVHSHQKQFPKEVDPKQSHQIILRYVVPKHIDIQDGQVRFTVGLINVTEGVDVGLQYFRRHRKDPSYINNITFNNLQEVMGWILPVRAISPSLENQLVLHFDEKSTQHIKFDFLRLEYIPIPVRPLVLSRAGLWKIHGKTVKNDSNGKLKHRGMEVTVNGYRKRGHYEVVYIIQKPNIEVLTIYRNGDIYPTHEPKNTRKSRFDQHKLHDVTGFTFGIQEVSRVNVDSYLRLVTITYSDFSSIKLSYEYTNTKSVIRVEDVRSEQETLTFFSTYISALSSAVGKLIVDNKDRFHIMDSSITGLGGDNFKFENNAHSILFGDVSDQYEIQFG